MRALFEFQGLFSLSRFPEKTMAGSNDEDRVVAAALPSRQAEDMPHTLPSFDDCFSRLSLSCAESESESALRSAEQTIMRWDVGSDPSSAYRPQFLWTDKREEVPAYLDAVDGLIAFLHSTPPPLPEIAGRVDNALQFAMLRLEMEFCHIIQKHSEPANPKSLFHLVSVRHGFDGGFSFGSSTSRMGGGGVGDEDGEGADDYSDASLQLSADDGEDETAQSRSISDVTLDLLLAEAVSDLCGIASRMVRYGCEAECRQAYVALRQPVVEESLGLTQISVDDVKRMPWEILESEIVKWIQSMKVAVRCLLPSEKRLCDAIFAAAGSPAASRLCFAAVATAALEPLLAFADAFAVSSSRAAEKLFRILDMYECLGECILAIDSTLGGVDQKSAAAAARRRLGELARETLAEFQTAIQQEASRSAVPGAAVHPMTRYVMNYVRLLSDYTDTVNQLLSEGGGGAAGRSGGNEGQMAPAAASALSLMEMLEGNLEAKSRLYKDAAMANLFLMNNVHYMCQKAKGTEIRELVGDGWIKRSSGKLRQYHNNYRRAAWSKVVSCLRDDGGMANSAATAAAFRNALKEKLKSFNAALEENLREQWNWVVQEPQLCEELRISIAEMLLPAYRSFLGRFERQLEDVKKPEKYVKYSPEEVEAYISGLFQGRSGGGGVSFSATTTSMRRRSFSSAGIGGF